MPTKAIRGQKLFDEIIRMSDQFEGKYKKAFLRSMLSINDDKELKSLINDISQGRLNVGSNIGSRLDKVRVDIAEMNELSRQTMVKAANVTKKVMNLTGSFDVVNDAVIEAARQMSIQLSTNLRATTRENLRQIIEDFAAGDISRQEAVRQIQMNVGLLPQHAQAVKTYRNTLLSSGTPRQKANQLAEQYAKRLLKYRADTIARTEVGRAVGVGKTNFWRQMQQQDMLPPDAQRVWITEPVGACPFCISMNGEPASIDGGWDTSKGYLEYPKASHPNCRCDDGIVMSQPKKGNVKKVDEASWENWVIAKHLSGKHDQKTHAGKRKVVGVEDSSGRLSYKGKAGVVIDSAPKPTEEDKDDLLSGEVELMLKSADNIFNVEIETENGIVRAEVIDVDTEYSDNYDLVARVEGVIRNEDGSTAGEFTRMLNPETGNVYNAYFRVSPEYQGTGLGTTLMAHWEDQYARAGFKTMTVTATTNQYLNGAYTWAKYGYKPTKDSARRVVSQFSTHISRSGTKDSDRNAAVRESIANRFGLSGRVTDYEISVALSNEYGTNILKMIADYPSFGQFLAGSSQRAFPDQIEWSGKKNTKTVTKSEKDALEVVRRWMAKDPAGLENDDPRFWQEIADAYGTKPNKLNA